MINIKTAKVTDAEVLALLGRITYSESHGHFIDDKNDLLKFLNNSFSITEIKNQLKNTNNLFYILYVDDFPVGYTKLVLNELHESVKANSSCRLEKIYILNDFLPLKLGQHLFDFIVGKAIEHQFKNIWLSVYIKNFRAINFYKKNGFEITGTLDYIVNNKKYENFVYAKKI
ncbi:GNAT family N-acetyltransferase [Tenacibaculum ovolyticum]|uniref:GNAT family N-acetyltransferase n=1 Tax=Tenacibaculum ovolyticum TaxID=104270 RepID=UPI0004063228|nr:GNAT family N-acetyltransferase [Tenacibaculum ovolyticum]